MKEFPRRGATVPIGRVEAIAGNDAYIVACLLARNGIPALLWSNPIAEELVTQGRRIAIGGELAFGSTSSEYYAPANYCLFEPDGVRTWLPISIEVPDPRQITEIEAYQYVYVDFYDEIIDRIVPFIRERPELCSRIYLNLSASGHIEKCAALEGLPPIYGVQLSMGQSQAEAATMATEFARRVRPEVVLCTLAHNGALAQAGGTQVHVTAPKEVTRKNGAGAVFSSAFLQHTVSGENVFVAQQKAVQAATAFCCEADQLISL